MEGHRKILNTKGGKENEKETNEDTQLIDTKSYTEAKKIYRVA